MGRQVRFDRFRFDTETGRLWAGEEEVRLTPKAAAVMGLLVTHGGELVAKEDLFAAVWPDTAVSDDALTTCISELRRALEKCVRRHWAKRDWIERDPDFDSLRDDPRFQGLLAKLK